MKIDFEQFLMDKHSEEINCTDRTVGDDELHDAYVVWRELLPSENVDAYADEFAELMVKQAMTMAGVQLCQ
jgi:hypothetical protein